MSPEVSQCPLLTPFSIGYATAKPRLDTKLTGRWDFCRSRFRESSLYSECSLLLNIETEHRRSRCNFKYCLFPALTIPWAYESSTQTASQLKVTVLATSTSVALSGIALTKKRFTKNHQRQPRGLGTAARHIAASGGLLRNVTYKMLDDGSISSPA